jgi:hypothetical protein
MAIEKTSIQTAGAAASQIAQLANGLAQRGAAFLADGVPAQPQRGYPACSAAEFAEALGEEGVTKLEAHIAANSATPSE